MLLSKSEKAKSKLESPAPPSPPPLPYMGGGRGWVFEMFIKRGVVQNRGVGKIGKVALKKGGYPLFSY